MNQYHLIPGRIANVMMLSRNIAISCKGRHFLKLSGTGSILPSSNKKISRDLPGDSFEYRKNTGM